MSKACRIALVVTMMMAFRVSTSYAYNGIGFAGANCEALTGSTSNAIYRGAGDGAPTAGDGQMSCPVSYPQNTTQTFSYDTVQIEIYDNASAGDMACTPFSEVPSVAGVWGTTLHTCNVWGGCTSNSSPASTGWTALYYNNSNSYLGLSSGGHNYVVDYSGTAVFCTFPLNQYNGVWAYRFYLN